MRLHKVTGRGNGSAVAVAKLWSWGGLVSLALSMFAVLGMLGWYGASPAVLVVVGLFLLAVALGRSILWRGTRPGLAATFTGALFGVVILCYLLRYVHVSFPMAQQFGSPFPERLIIEMVAVIPACAALGCAVHIILSACDCACELACTLYSAWGAREPLGTVLRREQFWDIGVYVLLAVIAVGMYRAVETAVCSHVARDCLFRSQDGPPPLVLPVENWLLHLQYGPSVSGLWRDRFYRLYQSCRDRLVASGALVHRRFVFKHVTSDSKRASAVLHAAFVEFPQNIHTSGNYTPGKPLVLEVYAPPEEIPEWERFVRERDVPVGGNDG